MSDIKIVSYSEKSFCVIGETFDKKDILKEMGGKFNKYLTIDNKRVSGWIFSNKKRDLIEKWYRDINVKKEENYKNSKKISDNDYIEIFENRVKLLAKKNKVLNNKLYIQNYINKDENFKKIETKYLFEIFFTSLIICFIYYLYCSYTRVNYENILYLSNK